MRKNLLFKGCTRPPMFMGVPYVPFAIGTGACLLLTFYLNMFFLVLLPVVVMVMRQMARRDEMVFRMLGLQWMLRLRVRNVARHDGLWVLSPNAYRPRLHGDPGRG